MQTAVLFDLDGVIINTEAQYTTFWEKIGQNKLPHLPHFAKSIKGHTLKQILAEYFSNDSTTQQSVVDELNAFEQHMDFPYVNGAVDFVNSLRANGFYTAIVTSSNMEKMRILNERHPEFATLFDHIFTAENVQRSKPAPDCYIQAATHFGLEAKECFVFEDSISGLQAGQNSGATVIGLTTSNPAEIISSYCQLSINDFTEIDVVQMRRLKN